MSGGAEERSDQELLAALSRHVLVGGLSWRLVEARWGALCEALADFDPGVLAALDGAALDRLLEAPGMIRNAAKLEAVGANARAVEVLAALHGSFGGFVASLRDLCWEERVGVLRTELRRVGERTAWRFLRDAGEPVPEPAPWEE